PLEAHLGGGAEGRQARRLGPGRPARQVGAQVLLAAQRVGQPSTTHQERVTRPGYGGAETEGFAGRFGQVGEGGRGLVGAGRRREAEVHGEAGGPGGLGGGRAAVEGPEGAAGGRWAAPVGRGPW